MSTNYYFINKDSRKEAEEFNEKLTSLFEGFSYQLKQLGVEDTLSIELEKWMYEKQEERIHIGKRSVGWRPLFQACDEFKSVRDMKKWYMSNKDEYTIENEYEKELSWLELESELIGWNGEYTPARKRSRYANYYLDEDGYEWTYGEFS